MKVRTKRRVKRATDKIEHNIQAVSKCMPVLSITIGIALSVLAFIKVSYFYDNYSVKFQTPIKVTIQIPVYIQKRTPEKIHSPISAQAQDIDKKIQLSEHDLIMQQKHGSILWKIYQLETQRGITDYCRLHNTGFGGFGVKVDNKIYCYDTFAQAVQRAEYWLSKLNIDKNAINALCTWNLGYLRDNNDNVIDYVNCSYYQDYLIVK